MEKTKCNVSADFVNGILGSGEEDSLLILPYSWLTLILGPCCPAAEALEEIQMYVCRPVSSGEKFVMRKNSSSDVFARLIFANSGVDISAFRGDDIVKAANSNFEP